jgi:lysophospholipase L1-like esterase
MMKFWRAFLLVILMGVGARAEDSPVVQPLKLEGKMVCIGASITAGEGVKPDESYVGLLKAKVATEHLKLEIVGQGRGGWSTGAYVANKQKMQDAMPADATIVSILLGTNDSRDTGTPAEVGKKAGENLAKLIDIYREKVPNAQFVIVSPTRQYTELLTKRLLDAHYGAASAANLVEISAAFKAVAKERGFLFIDLTEVPSSKDKSIDGVHPNAAGHEELFEAYWKALTASRATTKP